MYSQYIKIFVFQYTVYYDQNKHTYHIYFFYQGKYKLVFNLYSIVMS